MTAHESSVPVANDLPLQRMAHWEKNRPHHVFLTQPMGGGVTRDYTFAQAIGEARSVAAWLKAEGAKRGWPKGTCIATMSKNCAHWIMSDFAIWMAGYVSVPLYPTLAAQTVKQILEHSEAKALFVGKLDDWGSMKAGVPQGLLCFTCTLSPEDAKKNGWPDWDDIVAKTKPLAEIPQRGGDELATIIYTSGTTGTPKGVMHSFKTFAAAVEIGSKIWKPTEGGRMLSHLPLSHVAERVGVETFGLYHAYRIFFAESIESFARDMRAARPTTFMTVPRLWSKFQQGVFAKMPKKRLDVLFRIPVVGKAMKKKVLAALGLDACVIALGGAAPMPPSMLEWYRSLGLELLEAYGMTENFAVSHCNRPGSTRNGYVGQPQADVECKLSETGEVLVRSACNMLGYFKEPEKTREVLSEDGWLKTGDVGEIDEQGRLKITGRAKELFKTSKGKYVAPAPIENKLSAHPKIEACCVTGANFGQPFGIVMLPVDLTNVARDAQARAELDTSLADHLDQVNAGLDPHEQLDFLAVVPDQWTVENGFITPTMKIKRNVLEKHYEPRFEAWARERKPVVWAQT
jgi:long-chain acyl-CoA synthetase